MGMGRGLSSFYMEKVGLQFVQLLICLVHKVELWKNMVTFG